MSKIAIIFQGIGYNTDKPLLYYGKKLAREFGYEVIEVAYDGFESNVRGKQDKMEKAFHHALAQAKDILAEYTFEQADEVLIISKSLGTVVAGAWQKQSKISARNIVLTPVEATFQFMDAESGIVFHGTSDAWVKTEIVEAECKEMRLPLYRIEGADHSLEVGNVEKDLQSMCRIMEHCREYLQGNEPV